MIMRIDYNRFALKTVVATPHLHCVQSTLEYDFGKTVLFKYGTVDTPQNRIESKHTTTPHPNKRIDQRSIESNRINFQTTYAC